MDFADQIKALANQIPRQLEHLATEEATKTALVMPFINAFGYNVFDPTEVVPEYTADVGTKKGEKVDYAIMKEGKPIILFECKSSNTNLEKVHASQLYRYFSVTEARFGILTNGVIYRFFTDLDEPNKMDSKPFLEINMLNINEQIIEELKRFTKSSFDLEETISAATELKYTKEIKKIFAAQLHEPSDDFVRFFAAQVFSGPLRSNVIKQFVDITRRALRQYINEQISTRFKSALTNDDVEEDGSSETEEVDSANGNETDRRRDGIETTEDEIEAFHIVKSIIREIIDPGRIVIRDAKTYCSVLLDDSNRKPICRLWFNTSQKYLGLFDENKQEEKVPIEVLNDIYKYVDRLKVKIQHYDNDDSAMNKSEDGDKQV